MDKRTATALGTLAGMIVLAVVSWSVSTGGSDPQPSDPQPSATYSIIAGSSPGPSVDAENDTESDAGSGLSCTTVAQLPSQARDTLELIDDDGPFPYEEDGTVFGNYEGLLPRESRGYYHEYTVITPGEDDRGARRIIVGAQDEEYWTADHYSSFAQICAT